VPRDAITHHLLESRRVIREMGLRSEILCEDDRIDPTLAGEVRGVSAWDDIARPEDAAILHYSIDSSAFRHVLARCGRTAIHYHNITPAELLWRDAPAVAMACLRGRRELASFAGRVVASAADSRFNADELAALGFPTAMVVGVMRRELPVVVASSPAQSAGRPLRLLFVGRGVPNKAQHHLIASLAALRQGGADAQLHLIGSWQGMEAYAARCARLARDLRVTEHVLVEGSVDDDLLARAYAGSDAFVCLSDHEGFCIPVLEALDFGLPVVARPSGGVPEVAGDAALLCDDRDPAVLAELVALAIEDAELRDELRARGRARVEAYAPAETERRMRDVLSSLG
jgi:glycosyltransferase involved in cell wall biosynthesis